MYITEQFAEFIKNCDYNCLPPEVVSAAKERILDTLGAAVAGYANWDYSGQLVDACRPLGTGAGSVIGSKAREFPAARVAMINATFAHAVELDDGHKNAGCHAGAVVVPAALAMGAELGCSGEELIAAVVAGYEVVYRIAAQMNPAQIDKGFHPSSNCGVFGAMAAAGKLMGLTKEQLANGLGQAGMLASGTMEATVSGQRAKCVQVGHAAYNGILAAYLAKTGMEGCVTALEGKNGLFFTQSEHVNTEAVYRGLGEHFTITETYNKMYPCCRHAQPGIEAVLDLAEEHGLTAEQMERIEIGTHQVAYDLTGKIKMPRNSGEAKFSLAYGAAVALRERAFGTVHLTESYYTDPELLEMAGRVHCEVDIQVQERFPMERGAKVRLLLRDGGVLERELYNLKGSPDNPVGWAELERKFRANTAGVLSQKAIEDLVGAIGTLEGRRAADIVELLT